MNKNLFEEKELLIACDRTLMLSEHYNTIFKIHLNALKQCNNILDSGCGTGVIAIELLKKNKKVSAIDTSCESLNILKEKAIKINKLKNLVLIKKDASNLKTIKSESFDGVNSMIVAHLIKDFEKYISECYKVLKFGGCFIITARSNNKKQELLIEILKESLEKKGLFKKHLKDFEIISESLLKTANFRSKNLLSPQKTIQILESTGFKNIKEIENKTKDVMYTLIAYKI